MELWTVRGVHIWSPDKCLLLRKGGSRIEMGHRCCGKQKVKRGLWSPEEDEKLIRYITTHGHGSWSSVPKLAGLFFSLSLFVFVCV